MSKEEFSKYLAPSLDLARKRTKEKIKYVDYVLDEAYKNVGKDEKYFIITYGCQGNEADSETMAGILEQMGYHRSPNLEESDLIIINTCAIRQNAENRVWGELGRLKKYKTTNPKLLFVLAGCMPQEESTYERVTKIYSQVDIVIGTHNITKLPLLIMDAKEHQKKIMEVFSCEGQIIENLPKKRNNPHKAFVSIMFGCDEFCTYCIVPYTRGKERSRNKESIIEEVKSLQANGYQEVTLLGQNVNAYGKDFKDIIYTFGDLLNDLAKTNIARIRFTTSHPHDLDDKTIIAISSNKNIMPHFHLPVQSGSDNVLKRMNRHYTKKEYLERLEQLKKLIPGISVTTDIIVGFPNETNEDFLETLELVVAAKFEGAYTFIYSKRAGTPAANFLDNVAQIVKEERLQTLNKLIVSLAKKGNERFVGEIVEVLVDGPSKKNNEVLSGYSAHNKLVNFKGQKNSIGKIIKVKIILAKTWFLVGEAVE